MTERATVENSLIQRFQGSIQVVDESTIPILDQFKNGQFGNAYLAYLLYCNGRSSATGSSQDRNGLAFISDQAVFGIGCFAEGRETRSDLHERPGSVHLICPMGLRAIETASSVAHYLAARFPGLRIYLRHLNIDQYDRALSSKRWRSVEDTPWHLQAAQEDETYHHRRLVLEELLAPSSTSTPVRTLESPNCRSFRRKAHLAYSRFQNFLRRNNLEFVLRAHSEQHVDDALGLIAAHFQEVSRNKPLIGSSHEDYRGIATFVPEGRSERFDCRIGFLQGKGWCVPISFFAGERIGNLEFGCYASITRRNTELLPKCVQPCGFTAISQYALLEWLLILSRSGVREVDLGGSETPSLDRFKRQFGAHERASFWALYSGLATST